MYYGQMKRFISLKEIQLLQPEELNNIFFGNMVV